MRERLALQAGRRRRLHVYICIPGATTPASWPREATSRTHLYCRSDSACKLVADVSDNPCKLAAGGELSYTITARPTAPASWPREATSRIHLYYGSDDPASWPRETASCLRSDNPESWPREATSRIHLYYGSDNPASWPREAQLVSKISKPLKSSVDFELLANRK